MTALNAETEDVTLNVDLKIDDSSERWNWEVMIALNADNWINGFERRTESSGNDSEYRSENRWWLWTPKLKSDDNDTERRTGKW